MRTEEDEAFDELARRQGMWGGGFPAKRAMAANKLLEEATRSCNNIDEQRALDALMREAQPTHCQCTACKNGILHASDCAVHNGPAYPAGPCDCGVAQEPVARVLQTIKELRPAIKPMEGMGKGKTTEEWFDILVKEIERIQPAQQEALYGMNQDDWKDVVAAITKVRDGRGMYLGCRPADVFQDWFLALGTAKVKEKNT
jgi:hypothetical protein